MNARLEREKTFHNNRFEQGTGFIRRKRIAPFYTIARSSFDAYNNHVFSHLYCLPVRILEFGCGEGDLAFQLAFRGADVVGIDISETAVKHAMKKLTMYPSLSEKLDFLVMNAENLIFPEGYFDVVCGSAILQHLAFDTALSQIHKVLKIGGAAIFLEPLGHNPLINFYRRLTSQIRTPDEHPLLMSDIGRAARYFQYTYFEYYNLLTLLAVPFRNTQCFFKVLTWLEFVDGFFFKYFRFFRPLAWSVINIYKK